MNFLQNEFYLMDYDTYHQVCGGGFSDYIAWLNSIKPMELEDFTEPLLEEIGKVQPEKSTTDDSSHQILLFLLELLGGHYGIVFDDSNYPSMTVDEKIKEWFHLYQTIGMDEELTISKVKQYLKDLKRR